MYYTSYVLLKRQAEKKSVKGKIFEPVFTNTAIGVLKGTYEIVISYSWAHSAASNDVLVDFVFDGQKPYTTQYLHKEEPKDSTGQRMKTIILYVDVEETKDIEYSILLGNESKSSTSTLQDISVKLQRVLD